MFSITLWIVLNFSLAFSSPCRENAKQLMIENDGLQKQMLQTERDTIDVITFLKKEDSVKDTHVCSNHKSFMNIHAQLIYFSL